MSYKELSLMNPKMIKDHFSGVGPLDMINFSALVEDAKKLKQAAEKNAPGDRGFFDDVFAEVGSGVVELGRQLIAAQVDLKNLETVCRLVKIGQPSTSPLPLSDLVSKASGSSPRAVVVAFFVMLLLVKVISSAELKLVESSFLPEVLFKSWRFETVAKACQSVFSEFLLSLPKSRSWSLTELKSQIIVACGAGDMWRPTQGGEAGKYKGGKGGNKSGWGKDQGQGWWGKDQGKGQPVGAAAGGPAPGGQKPICHNYTKTGSCRLGVNCKFVHLEGGSEAERRGKMSAEDQGRYDAWRAQGPKKPGGDMASNFSAAGGAAAVHASKSGAQEGAEG
jgi:hypothetical protein